MKFIKSYKLFESLIQKMKKYAYRDLVNLMNNMLQIEKDIVLNKLELLDNLKIGSRFGKNVGLFKEFDEFLIYLNQVIENPYTNLILPNSLTDKNYILYVFNNSEQYNDYLKISKGTVWCTHKKSVFNEYVTDKNWYVLINNNLNPSNFNYKLSFNKISEGLFDCYNCADYSLSDYQELLPKNGIIFNLLKNIKVIKQN